MRRTGGDALLLSRIANQLVVRGHPIEQRNQLNQDALLQARRYNGPFRETIVVRLRKTQK